MVTKAQGAPGELELVRSFVNTLDVEDGVDEVAGSAALGEWLAARGLLAAGERVTRAAHGRALAVREALRALLLANNGAQPDPAAAADVQVERLPRRDAAPERPAGLRMADGDLHLADRVRERAAERPGGAAGDALEDQYPGEEERVPQVVLPGEPEAEGVGAHMCAMIARPNSEQRTSVAPSIRRWKS